MPVGVKRYRGSHCSRWALATYQDPMTGIIRIISPACTEYVLEVFNSQLPITRSLNLILILILIFFFEENPSRDLQSVLLTTVRSMQD